jgi:hypothetical protein
MLVITFSYLLLCINSKTCVNSKTKWYIQWIINLIEGFKDFILDSFEDKNMSLFYKKAIAFSQIVTSVLLKIINFLFNVFLAKKYFRKDHKNYNEMIQILNLLSLKLKKYLEEC